MPLIIEINPLTVVATIGFVLSVGAIAILIEQWFMHIVEGDDDQDSGYEGEEQ